jgi:YVTN family beta-propeller protein
MMRAQHPRTLRTDVAFAAALAALTLCLVGGSPAEAADPAQAHTLLVVNKDDSTVALLEFRTGKSIVTLPTGFTPHEVAASPDGKLAAVSNYGTGDKPGSTLTIVDVPAAKVARTVDLGDHTRPHGVCWYAPDRLAVTTEGSGHLLVVNPLSGKVLSAVRTGQEMSHQVAVAPGGRRAFVANIASGSVTAVDLERGAKLKDVPTGGGAEAIAVTPDGREVWVGNRNEGTISVIDATSLEAVAKIPCPGMPFRVAIAPDGRHALASATITGEVVLLDVRQRKEIVRRKLGIEPAPVAARRGFARLSPGSPMPVGLLLSADGATAVVAATMADKLAVLDAQTLEVRRVLDAGGEPDGLAFGAAGTAK